MHNANIHYSKTSLCRNVPLRTAIILLDYILTPSVQVHAKWRATPFKMHVNATSILPEPLNNTLLLLLIAMFTHGWAALAGDALS